MGGIVMTNDGNAILREITVQHPAAKTMIEISRTQDEEVGDGTTSVIILGNIQYYIFFYKSLYLLSENLTVLEFPRIFSLICFYWRIK